MILLAKEINPFIRRAFILHNFPYNRLVKNKDSRIFYILDGEGEIEIENKAYNVQPNCFVILKSGTSYVWRLDKSKAANLAIVNFDYNQNFSDITKLLGLIPKSMFSSSTVYDCGNFEDIPVLNNPIFLSNMTVFKRDVLEIISEINTKNMYSSEIASTILRNLILKSARYASTKASKETLKIEPVLEYIKLNFDKDITNISLGQIFNYHPHYINSLMKQYTGTTLHVYLTDYRMNEALNLLINSNLSIEAIASKVGYKSPTHFCNTFRKKFGISPAKHRKSSKMI